MRKGSKRELTLATSIISCGEDVDVSSAANRGAFDGIGSFDILEAVRDECQNDSRLLKVSNLRSNVFRTSHPVSPHSSA